LKINDLERISSSHMIGTKLALSML
jgi:hypothetical protein